MYFGYEKKHFAESSAGPFCIQNKQKEKRKKKKDKKNRRKKKENKVAKSARV